MIAVITPITTNAVRALRGVRIVWMRRVLSSINDQWSMQECKDREER